MSSPTTPVAGLKVETGTVFVPPQTHPFRQVEPQVCKTPTAAETQWKSAGQGKAGLLVYSRDRRSATKDPVGLAGRCVDFCVLLPSVAFAWMHRGSFRLGRFNDFRVCFRSTTTRRWKGQGDTVLGLTTTTTDWMTLR